MDRDACNLGWRTKPKKRRSIRCHHALIFGAAIVANVDIIANINTITNINIIAIAIVAATNANIDHIAANTTITTANTNAIFAYARIDISAIAIIRNVTDTTANAQFPAITTSATVGQAATTIIATTKRPAKNSPTEKHKTRLR